MGPVGGITEIAVVPGTDGVSIEGIGNGGVIEFDVVR